MSSASAGQEGRSDPAVDSAAHAAAELAAPVGPSVTVAGVARRLGVAPATLRTWDRRYGLGPSEHAAGSHRRYTPSDVARLEHMRRLVLAGVAPSDAARSVLAAPAPTAVDDAAGAVVTPMPRADSAMSAADGGALASARGGGGQVVPIPGGSPTARGLARAAMGLDAPAASEIIMSALRRDGVVTAWHELLAPVLIGVGRRYESTGTGVEVEHLLSECISGALRTIASELSRPVNLRPVLLACADEEQHTLPLHAVAAALAERNVATRMLGGRVPRGALAAAVRRSGPLAVMVWAQLSARGDVAQVAELPSLRPPPLVLVGGPGWPTELPPTFVRVTSLDDAVTRLANAALV